jgi:hypothetical protein
MAPSDETIITVSSPASGILPLLRTDGIFLPESRVAADK